MPDPALDWLRRDRALTLAALAAATVAAWAYLFASAGMDMAAMDEAMGPMAVRWSPGHAAAMLLMWAVMMAAMMLPGAAPMVLAYGSIARRRREVSGVAAHTGLFTAGYLAVWALFSVGAVLLQFVLDQAARLSASQAIASPALAGGFLIAAGLWQWTPLKAACLRRCRSPLDFILTEWRPGAAGAVRMGVKHGLYCVGCCWSLMLLLFVGGVMNLAWIGLIAAFVLVEKAAPAAGFAGRLAGAALVVWGGAILLI